MTPESLEEENSKDGTFILAKYAADIGRMEPRNIGVFLWMDKRLYAKFLPKSEAKQFVNEMGPYEQWITYWNYAVERQEVRCPRGGKTSCTEPECIEGLLSTQKGNYLLVEAGDCGGLMEPDEAIERLYLDLVTPARSNEVKNLRKELRLKQAEIDRLRALLSERKDTP